MSTVQYKRVYLKHGEFDDFAVCGTDDPEVCGQALLKFNTPEETWDSSQSYKGNEEMARIVDKEFWSIANAANWAVASEREAIARYVEMQPYQCKRILKRIADAIRARGK